MKNSIIGTLIAAGALAATPAFAQEVMPETPTTEAPAAEAPVTAEQAPPATLDTNGDGTMDAWDRNNDGKADAWDTNGDGQPDKADPMEAAE